MWKIAKYDCTVEAVRPPGLCSHVGALVVDGPVQGLGVQVGLADADDPGRKERREGNKGKLRQVTFPK